jgi:hypothetical protein
MAVFGIGVEKVLENLPLHPDLPVVDRRPDQQLASGFVDGGGPRFGVCVC